MPSSGGASEGPLISNPAHASHFTVERQKRKRRYADGDSMERLQSLYDAPVEDDDLAERGPRIKSRQRRRWPFFGTDRG